MFGTADEIWEGFGVGLMRRFVAVISLLLAESAWKLLGGREFVFEALRAGLSTMQCWSFFWTGLVGMF